MSAHLCPSYIFNVDKEHGLWLLTILKHIQKSEITNFTFLGLSIVVMVRVIAIE